LLSTFSTSLGEVALQPSTGGTFIVHLYHTAESDRGADDGVVAVQKHLLWDRKAEGGFPGNLLLSLSLVLSSPTLLIYTLHVWIYAYKHRVQCVPIHIQSMNT